MRLHSWLVGPALVLLAAGACRHAVGPLRSPVRWQELAQEAQPFVALYRLRCCGRGNLLATVRGDGARLLVTVTAPPGGAVLEVWLEGEAGWLHSPSRVCRDALPTGELPLAEGASLPLDARLASLLLTGRLPAVPVARMDSGGWVAVEEADWWLRALIEGDPPRYTRLVGGRAGGSSPLLSARLDKHRGQVPGRLSLTAGAVTAELLLVEWRTGRETAPPAWLALPTCEARP